MAWFFMLYYEKKEIKDHLVYNHSNKNDNDDADIINEFFFKYNFSKNNQENLRDI